MIIDQLLAFFLCQFFQVRIKFTRMAIEHDRPCDDYVQISEIDEKRIATPRKVYVRLCENSLGKVPENKREFVVKGPNALIHFHSDWIWSDYGFGLKYSIEGEGSAQPTPAPSASPANLPGI